MNPKYHLSSASSQEADMLHSPQAQHLTRLKHYVIGFIGSLILTLSAYFLSVHHVGNHNLLLIGLAILAFAQFILQLFYFLHVGHEFPPRLKLMLTCFMILVVTILVGGSLWIMFSLNNRVMPSTQQMVKYMNSQNSL